MFAPVPIRPPPITEVRSRANLPGDEPGDSPLPPPAAARGPWKLSLPAVFSFSGGALLLIGGLWGVLVSLALLTVDVADLRERFPIGSGEGFSDAELRAILTLVGSLALLLSLGEIVGGLCAVRRRRLTLAFLGGLCGLWGLVLFFLPTALLSVGGLVLIFLGRSDFRPPGPRPVRETQAP